MVVHAFVYQGLHAIILGDLNCNVLGSDPDDRALSDFCSTFGLSQLVKTPTRVTEKSKSLIDVALTTNENIIYALHRLHVLAASSACFVSQVATTVFSCLNFTSAVTIIIRTPFLLLWCGASDLTCCYKIFVHLAQVLPRPIRRSTPRYAVRHLTL